MIVVIILVVLLVILLGISPARLSSQISQEEEARDE